MQKLRFHGNQKGFTLVEIAIVLVIIGLLIGGVLKGQAMIQNAKVKRVVKLADEIRAATMGFYDKYGQYPGDENLVDIPAAGDANGDSSGQINTAAERNDVFIDLMNAKLISGNYTAANPRPKHAFGDDVFIAWVNPGSGADHYIEFLNLPWDVAREIDTKYDDGVYNTGQIRASEAYAEATSPVGILYLPL
ncbi:MAG: prepilin-type N-terminal cleavage/methylation domain-containing protein [Desulfobacterium sp.]|nr:prepilin-type N-terminal cleavage/methylation domain-containing protein [Desulfobacterium sp.]MBU3948639.1 prepilin-type N-terminal cleavage/methylation domain-containing protein [Pseudomonadota bacterium]MBU4011658.1 prepilin-type N-terminal cleavage/methylation domain-containing protein [Pseudomonadota bacterium]MBU4037999.1 prepilin-type N-terminal cleavage/methylation domain-containing protein [Pseudomonadota bacterium]